MRIKLRKIAGDLSEVADALETQDHTSADQCQIIEECRDELDGMCEHD